MSKKIRKAILPVAGFGTRFLPATKAQPKEMLPLVDKPIIQYLVEEAVNAGIEQIIFVTGKGKRAIEDHFDSYYELEETLRVKGKNELLRTLKEISNLAEFVFVRQKSPNGNGDALLSAKSLIGDEPCAILFGDDIVDSEVPAIKQMMSVYEKYQDIVVALYDVPEAETSKYGIAEGVKIDNRLIEINKFIEKPEPGETKSTLAAIGKYIITPEVFDILSSMQGKVSGELGLDNAFNKILSTRPIYGYQIEGTRYDCGDKLGYIKATIDYSLKHPSIGEGIREYIKSLDL
jgi:UTP--glucose-1-phosphate uridylyltransferase